MLPVIHENNHPTLENVQELFEQWRKEKKFRDHIPPALWEAALSLADSHPVYTIAKRLRLNYTHFKALLGTRSALGRDKGTTFIELGTLTATIELTKPTGERMTITGNCDVAELARVFLG